MHLPPLRARLTLVELTVRNILIEANITAPPVPVKDLLEQSAVVCWYNDEFEEGFCVMKGETPYVFLNKNIINGRDKFTFAHELGHLKMGHVFIDQSRITTWHERHIRREADYFAACLLMPEAWIRDAVGSDMISCDHVRGLVQMFGVSYEAMHNRLDELGLCQKEFIQWMWNERRKR